ncbi:MAG: sulfatase-like hydrolase/transferase [Chloroflexi bacterium]|jgi:arylsulfatase A-like enzyme|nr:sulfatase-like hydrolase/transferase [Chloroflexota bacterium]
MPRPNILIVMTDHQRADTVLPEHPAITPHVARLASEGVTFTNAFCPSPHCCPSRATFFTGLYPSQHGVWNNICNDQALSRGVREGVRLWSEDLAEAGYDLHFSGKWHVSVTASPADYGWTEHFLSGHFAQSRDWEHYQALAQQALASQALATERGEGEILRPGYGTYRLYGTRAAAPENHDEQAVQRALDVLPQLARGDSPWGLFVGLIGPHDPYMVPQRYLDMYDLEDVPLPPSYADTLADKPRIYQRMRQTRYGQLSDREVREGIRHFWAYCTYLDDLLGRLLAALDETGQAENTLVLFCADHGDYCGEHGLFAKGIPCFQGAYRVPAVMRWPAGIREPGRRVEQLVSLADFGPTFLDMAAVPTDRHFTGASLLPFLRGESPENWRDAIFTQCNGVELYYTQRSVMTQEFKYTLNGFDRDELYDLREDPHEMRNLADDPTYEPVKRDLCRRLWQFAYQERDAAINSYITVALAPYGPAIAFMGEQ